MPVSSALRSRVARLTLTDQPSRVEVRTTDFPSLEERERPVRLTSGVPRPDQPSAKESQLIRCALVNLAFVPVVRSTVVGPAALREPVGELRAVEAEATQRAALPQLHNQAIEQRLASKALRTVGQAPALFERA